MSIRAEVRFTRDVDLALTVDQEQLTVLVRDLRAAGYGIDAVLAHEVAKRTATVRLVDRGHVNVDLLAASSGIEAEIVASAEVVAVPGVGAIRVATAEDLLAMKVLSMTERRRRDVDDAHQLLLTNPALDLELVRARLRLIAARRYDRGQDLEAKLANVVAGVEAERA